MVKIEKQSNNNFIMSSFHEVQEQLLLSYEDGILDEDEFLLLHKQFMPISQTRNTTGFPSMI